MRSQDTLYRFTIDGTEFNTTDATLTPQQLRLMARLPDNRLILAVTPGGQVREIPNGQTVHLQGPHIEIFISREPGSVQDQLHYRFEVDGEVYETVRAAVRGQDIKSLAGLASTTPLYWTRHGQDVLVSNEQSIDLSAAGTEHFTTQARPETGHVTVTAVYTTTARSKTFQAQLTSILLDVVREAYTKLGETQRDGDSLLTGTAVRTDLRPQMQSTLQALLDQGVLLPAAHLTLHIDIDPAAGGA